jgi:hypothetical protein
MPTMSDAGDDLAELLDDDVQGDDDELVPPDMFPDEPGAEVGTLVEPDEGASTDLTAEAVAFEIDERGDSTLGDVATERQEIVPPEEAAMHLTTEPPMDDDDGYLT